MGCKHDPDDRPSFQQLFSLINAAKKEIVIDQAKDIRRYGHPTNSIRSMVEIEDGHPTRCIPDPDPYQMLTLIDYDRPVPELEVIPRVSNETMQMIDDDSASEREESGF